MRKTILKFAQYLSTITLNRVKARLLHVSIVLVSMGVVKKYFVQMLIVKDMDLSYLEKIDKISA